MQASNSYIIFLASTILIVVVSLITIIYNKKGKISLREKSDTSTFLKIIPLLSVIITILSTIVLSVSNMKELQTQESVYDKILNQDLHYVDSNNFTNENRDAYIDSLQRKIREIQTLMISIKTQEYLAGEQSKILPKASILLYKTKNQLNKIEDYNETLDMNLTLPFMEGYTTSSVDRLEFNFDCPKNLAGEYVDLMLTFFDSTLYNEIACLYVQVIAPDSVDGKLINLQVFNQIYKPKKSTNLIRIKNYFTKKNTELTIGYVPKSETNKKLPHIKRTSCVPYK